MNWEAGIAELCGRGFVREADGRYAGHLTTKFGRVLVRLALDNRGIRPPAIQIVEKPGWLPRFTGHISSDGTLCYIDEKLAHITRGDSVAVIVDSLAFAIKAIERLVDHGGQIDEEFSILWSRGELCVLEPSNADANWHWCIGGDEQTPFYCLLQDDDRKDVEAIARIHTNCPIPPPIKISLQRPPIAAGHSWPVQSLKDFFEWVRFVDEESSRRAEQELLGIARTSLRDGYLPTCVAFLLEHDETSFGFFAILKQGSAWLPRGSQLRRLDPSLVVKHWMRNQRDCTLRVRVRSLDAKSILRRAIGPSSPTFAGKAVTVIGAGSVGSYLADALVRCGAGSDGGSLRLIDFDVVGVENLARSNYSLAEVGQKKVVSLCNRILRAWPRISVFPMDARAEHLSDVLSGDYVFDASGDVAFSNWLSEERNRIGGPTLLTTWIVGSGRAVQSYLQHSEMQACLACLDSESVNSPWSALSSDRNDFVTGSCGDGFMPYSVSAPYIAAGLAVSHALQFLGKQNPEVLRTIFLEGTGQKIVRGDAPLRCSRCPCR